MKEQSFAKYAPKLLTKQAIITTHEVLENRKETDLFSYYFQSVHVPHISKKRKWVGRGMGKKERHSSTIITVIFLFPVSVVHILDEKPVIGVQRPLAAGACNSF